MICSHPNNNTSVYIHIDALVWNAVGEPVVHRKPLRATPPHVHRLSGRKNPAAKGGQLLRSGPRDFFRPEVCDVPLVSDVDGLLSEVPWSISHREQVFGLRFADVAK